MSKEIQPPNADGASSSEEAKKKPANLGEEKSTVDKAGDIKNAHASGDGSFGRNDGSLPEDEKEANANSPAY